MTKAYGIEDLSPESLYELVKQFGVPHSKLFQKYYSHYFVSYDDASLFCEEHCKVSQLCAIQYLDLPPYSDCTERGGKSQHK